MQVQWSLVFSTLFTGLGTGAFAVVAVAEWFDQAGRVRMPGAITALVAIAAGGTLSLLQVGRLDRVVNVLGHLTAPITQELLSIGLAGLVAVAYIVMLRRGSSDQARKRLALAGLALAVIVAVVLGRGYVLPSRPAWNTWLLPLLYAASAAVMGLYCMATWTALLQEASARSVNRAVLIALIVEAVVLVAYVVYLGLAPSQNPLRSPGRLLTGDLALVFWGAVVGVGLVVPLGLIAWLLSTPNKLVSPAAIAGVGTLCVIAGGIALRAQVFLLGSSVEQYF